MLSGIACLPQFSNTASSSSCRLSQLSPSEGRARPLHPMRAWLARTAAIHRVRHSRLTTPQRVVTRAYDGYRPGFGFTGLNLSAPSIRWPGDLWKEGTKPPHDLVSHPTAANSRSGVRCIEAVYFCALPVPMGLVCAWSSIQFPRQGRRFSLVQPGYFRANALKAQLPSRSSPTISRDSRCLRQLL